MVRIHHSLLLAEVAEQVDALRPDRSERTLVWVRFPPSALYSSRWRKLADASVRGTDAHHEHAGSNPARDTFRPYHHIEKAGGYLGKTILDRLKRDLRIRGNGNRDRLANLQMG